MLAYVISALSNWLYTYILVALLLAAGLYFTLRTRFVQLRMFGESFRVLREEKHEEGGVSSFQALMISTASRVGTGNIAGVSIAICLGGVGAVFWMWLVALLGGASAFIESTLAQIYKVPDGNGGSRGGPAYYIEKVLGSRGLALLFSVFLILTYMVGFNMVASYNLMDAFSGYSFFSPTTTPTVVGVVLAVLTALCIMGGSQRLSRVTGVLVPVMGGIYVLAALVMIVLHIGLLPGVIAAIFRNAFDFKAIFGGFTGSAMMHGIKRGLFSNESGMGSAPLVASAAQTRNPVRQALVSATGTFWDTVVVCLMTGLVLVTTIMKNPAIDMAQISDGGQLTTLAFAQIPVLGPVILVVGIITFAWSTILGWSYYGERCAQYLWGKRALLPYKLVFVAVVVVGPVLALDLVWTIADILNALMAIPNLVAVLLLSGVVARETRHYLGNLDEVDQTEIPRVDK